MRFIKLVIFLSFLALISLSFASGEILLNQPESVYNFGDSINVGVKVRASQETKGFLELFLNCLGIKESIYKEYVNLNTNEEKTVDTSVLITDSLLTTPNVLCSIGAGLLGESKETQKFKISNKIDVVLNLNNLTINPGQGVDIKGTAKKENRNNVDGFADIKVDGTDIKVTKDVKAGEFSSNIAFPDNIKSGEYVLVVEVYEKLGNDTINEGKGTGNLIVKSIPKRLEIVLDEKTASPGSDFSYKVIIFDQADTGIDGDVGVKIYNTEKSIINQKIIKAGSLEKLKIGDKEKPGYWEIKAESSGLKSDILFYLEELEKAEFRIENNTLIINNTGNVVYRKPIEVSVGGETEVKNIELDVGESIVFKLSAPDGEYQIKVSDGSTNLNIQKVSLTGSAVEISELREVGVFFRYPIPVLFLILVAGLFILMMVKKMSKKKSYSYGDLNVPRAEEDVPKKEIKKEKSDDNKFRKAEHTLVLNGTKESTGLLTLRIKNLNDKKKTSPETINSIYKKIVENKGIVYETSDFVIAIFSPSVTKTFNNELIAVKLSENIKQMLQEHNKKFRDKISFGISLNSGELFVKSDRDKFRFTGIGKTLSLSKKLAELSNQEILLSDEFQKKKGREIKTEKETRGGIDVYHIKRIIDRKTNERFIHDFLERLDKDKK